METNKITVSDELKAAILEIIDGSPALQHVLAQIDAVTDDISELDREMERMVDQAVESALDDSDNVTYRYLETHCGELREEITEEWEAEIATRDERISALELRIAALERPSFLRRIANRIFRGSR